MYKKYNYLISAAFFLFIVTIAQGQSSDEECDFGCTVVLEGYDCSKRTAEETGPCYDEACCRWRREEEKRRLKENSNSGGQSESKETEERTLNVSGSSRDNSNEGESENEEDESDNEEDDSEGNYNRQYSLTTTYNQLVSDMDRMRSNGQIGTPTYNRKMQEIRQLENRLGISGPQSYSSQATTNDLAYSVAGMISSIPEADSYTSTVGLTYSLNYINNINLVLTEGWVWGNLFLDMKFSGVVVPTKGWEYEQVINTISRVELQNFAAENNARSKDLFVRNQNDGYYAYYKYNENILGYGGGMGLALGLTFPIANKLVLKTAGAVNGEVTNLYYRVGYGFEADFCVGKWVVGLGYQTSDYYVWTPLVDGIDGITSENKVIFDDPELNFSTNYSDDLNTLDESPEELNQIKNHFVLRLAYAW